MEFLANTAMAMNICPNTFTSYWHHWTIAKSQLSLSNQCLTFPVRHLNPMILEDHLGILHWEERSGFHETSRYSIFIDLLSFPFSSPLLSLFFLPFPWGRSSGCQYVALCQCHTFPDMQIMAVVSRMECDLLQRIACLPIGIKTQLSCCTGYRAFYSSSILSIP